MNNIDLLKIKKQVMDEFGVENVMATPSLSKISINISLKEAVSDKGVLDKAVSQLTEIAGQKAKITRIKKSIANFKVREGDPIGVTATLRGKRAVDFSLKLFNLALPRVRDFHGVSTKGFDGRGNYTLGLTEQIVFPEIDYAKIDKIRGLQVTFVFANSSDKMSRRFLELMGMPFEKA